MILWRPSPVAVPIPALVVGRTARAFSSERRAQQGLRLGPVESFVDDLKPNRVLYGVRAALLQRSLEIQPAFFTIRFVSSDTLLSSYSFFLFFVLIFFYLFFFLPPGGPASRVYSPPPILTWR